MPGELWQIQSRLGELHERRGEEGEAQEGVLSSGADLERARPEDQRRRSKGGISFGASGTTRARAHLGRRAPLQREGCPSALLRSCQRETAHRRASQRSHNAPALGFREGDRHRIAEVTEGASDDAAPTTTPQARSQRVEVVAIYQGTRARRWTLMRDAPNAGPADHTPWVAPVLRETAVVALGANALHLRGEPLEATNRAPAARDRRRVGPIPRRDPHRRPRAGDDLPAGRGTALAFFAKRTWVV